MIASFSYYSEGVQARMASIEHGLVSKHSYVPTVSDVRVMGDEFRKLENISGDIVPQIWVDEGTAAWAAWQKVKPLGTPCIDRITDDGKKVRGWYFPTEYPPA